MNKQEKTSFYVIWKFPSVRIRLIVALGFAGIMAGLSLIPGSSINSRWNIRFLDKIGHFIAYALFARILVGLFRSIYKSEICIVKPILWTFTIATSYGMLMEVLQIFVPDRTCSYADMVANTLGIATMLVISCYRNGLMIELRG